MHDLDQQEAESMLTAWATARQDRDTMIRQALAAGLTKHRIHLLTGISRTTIDRIITNTNQEITR